MNGNDTNKQVKVRLRAVIDDKCPACTKKKRSNAAVFNEHTPPPELLMVSARPMCVMVTEVGNEEEKYLLFYECEDEWCLLNHLREGLMSTWLANLKTARDREYEQARLQAMKNHKSRGRRGNRRARAKAKAKTTRPDSTNDAD